MKRVWNEHLDNLLRRHYPKGDIKALAARIGVSPTALKSRAGVLKLRRKVHERRPWTKRHIAYLRSHYANQSAEEIAPKVKHTVGSVYQKAKALGLEKAPDFLRIRGSLNAQHPNAKAHRFKKGSAPSNKGKRQEDFMSPEAIERTKATRFKKGNVPHNSKPVGYERINDDGYILIKVGDRRKMVLKHRYIWELHNGFVPEGHIVAFRDGNRLNCNLENLFLMSWEDNARRRTAEETPEQKKQRIAKCTETRNKTIRRDRIRIHFGLRPLTKIVKRW